jgi:hypothetical protein
MFLPGLGFNDTVPFPASFSGSTLSASSCSTIQFSLPPLPILWCGPGAQTPRPIAGAWANGPPKGHIFGRTASDWSNTPKAIEARSSDQLTHLADLGSKVPSWHAVALCVHSSLVVSLAVSCTPPAAMAGLIIPTLLGQRAR